MERKVKDNNKDRHVVKTEHFILYKREDKEKYVKNDNGTYDKVPSKKVLILYINDFMHLESSDRSELTDLLTVLTDERNCDELQIMISSPGGLVRDLFSLISVLDSNGYRNKTYAHILDGAYSAGALLWSWCKYRSCSNYGGIMLHDISYAKYDNSGNHLTKAQHTTKVLEKYLKDNVVKNKIITKKEMELVLAGKDLWLDYDQLKSRKALTHKYENGAFTSLAKK